MTTQQIQDIEDNIREAQKIVDLGQSLERLMQNRDFKKIIMGDYFEKEAVRLVHLKADAAFQTPERQKSILSQMDAIGALNQYFQGIFHSAEMARKSITADTEMRDEILADEGELTND